jgi:ABC-2 type transport system ATP-binding protein
VTVLLRVTGLTKGYGNEPVVQGIDLAVRAGRAVAVTGPNGAGKSTLLACVVGAEAADAGAVLLDGAPLRDSAASRAAVAALLDDLAFFPDLSVVEHLRLLAWSHGAPDPDRTVDDLLRELGLDVVRDHLPAALSSGQAHRLGLATCLVRPRRLLVLDEPEARLDAAGQRWLAGRLVAEKASGTGVLFASHSPSLVAEVADEVVELP